MAKTTSKPQSERFEQAARELGVELDEEKLKETLRRIVPERSQHKSDASADDSSEGKASKE